jgi:hypothetical protein
VETPFFVETTFGFAVVETGAKDVGLNVECFETGKRKT